MQTVNSFSGGMHSGIDPSVFPPGSYRYMNNGHIFSKDDHGFVVTNIKRPGVAFTMPDGYMPIGSVYFADKLYIISYNALDSIYGDARIELGYYEPSGSSPAYTLVMNVLGDSGIKKFNLPASIFGMSTDHLLDCFARESYDGTPNIYICDGNNANIVIHVGQTYTDTTSNPATLDDFRLFKGFDSVPVITGEVVTGGALKPGNYFIAFRYTTRDLNSTTFINQIGPFIITGDRRGLIDDVRLSRAIQLTISNLDEDYEYLEVAVVRYFGETGTRSVEMWLIDNKYPIITDGILISGDEKQMVITAEELLENNTFSDRCVSHTQHDGRYVGAGWLSDGIDRHQALAALASKIIPEYVIKEGDSDSIISAMSRSYVGLNANQDRKFKAGECYPFAVSFIINGRHLTDAYPICGYDSNMFSKAYMDEIMATNYTFDYMKVSRGLMEEPESYQCFYTQSMNDSDCVTHPNNYISIPEHKDKLRIYSTFSQGSTPIIFFKERRSFAGSATPIPLITDDPIPVVESEQVPGHFLYGTIKHYTTTIRAIVLNNTVKIVDTDVLLSVTSEGGNITDESSIISVSYNLWDPSDPGVDMLANDFDSDTLIHNISIRTVDIVVYVSVQYSGYVDNAEVVVIGNVSFEYGAISGVEIISSSPALENDYTGYQELAIPSDAQYCSVSARTTTVELEWGERVYVSFDNLVAANKGLFRFPFAKSGKDPDGIMRSRLHYAMMGIRFDTTYIDGLLEANHITGIIIMQGERVVNCISQGVAINLLDRLVIHKDYKAQVIGLGDGQRPVYFPWVSRDVYDGSQADNTSGGYGVFNFPVMLLRGTSGNDLTINNNEWGYASPFFMASALGADGEYDDATNGMLTINGGGREAVWHHHGASIPSYVSNNATDNCINYAYLSPDDFNNENLQSVYMRSLSSVDRFGFTQSKNKKCVSLSKPGGTDDGARVNITRPFEYAVNDMSAYLPNTLAFKDDALTKSFVSCTPVENKRMIPDDNGCISKMRSVFDVFGGLTVNGYDDEYVESYITGKTRHELFSAGIPLNRYMAINDTQVSGLAPIFPYVNFNDAFQGWHATEMFSTRKITIPCVITNLSMESAPYSHFRSTAKDSDGHNMNLKVVEKYKYDPDASDVYETIKGLFNPSSSTYHPIAVCRLSDVSTFDQQVFYTGDVYAQVVSLRVNRWSTEAENNQRAADHRHGQMMTVYLESFMNHNNRVVSVNKSFWPYVSSYGYDKEMFAFASNAIDVEQESYDYNDGNHELQGVVRRFGIDMNIPGVDYNKPNRLYYSDRHLSGSLVDAYSKIRTEQYKDYGFEYGAIKKVLSFSGNLFIIHEDGINQLFTSNNLQTVDESNLIVLGQEGFLRDESRNLSPYGTQHPLSIIKGERGVYGVDIKRKTIWLMRMAVSDKGGYFFVVEDINKTKQLYQLFEDMNMTEKILADSLYGGDDDTFRGVVSGADAELRKIYFTFHLNSGIYTLVYDESQMLFTSFYDYTPNIYLPMGNRVVMYKKFTDMSHQDGYNNTVFLPEDGTGYHDFDYHGAEMGDNQFVLTFFVNAADNRLSNMEKEYLVHKLFASDNLLQQDLMEDFMRKIEWQTEYQGSSLDLSGMDSSINDANKFWKTPIFEDHVWNVPIDVQSTSNDGPNGTEVGQSYMQGSTLRGAWLKVTIRYSGDDPIFIKNCITHFNNSFS